MAEQNRPQAETIEAEIRIGSESVRLSARISNDPVYLHEMLPLFQNLTNKIVEIGVKEAEARGKRISCRNGCGACCSQLVPVGEAEGVALLDLIDVMPAARQTEIRARFLRNMTVLRQAGLLENLDRAVISNDRERLRAIGIDYFKLNMPCPFLENQSCSIHPSRPLSCREFLVVSDPLYCARSDPERVECVALPKRISPILYTMSQQKNQPGKGFLPLAQLLTREQSLREDQPSPEPAVDLLKRFLGNLAN
ncbi:MAG: YkgJ family cysteine cluster protein [Candidatus Thiodiazotropha sp. (ex Epidulcina cf. delphinae)]|nr:YkgJ family cysteine cluster protein [Candidatus Thiodiazotropha sp. (ex Epidulcina cf. delphinae)]